MKNSLSQILLIINLAIFAAACNLPTNTNDKNDTSLNTRANNKSSDNEDDHPYQNQGDPIKTNVAGLLPGLPNLGNTCFANASINFLLSSKEITDILSSPLPKKPKEKKAHYLLRLKFQKTLKALYDARKENKKDLTEELNNYFDAYEVTRKEVIAEGREDGEKVSGKDKLRTSQGDARDFIEDNLTLLNYATVENVAFTYNKFKDDKSIRVSQLPEKIIGLEVKDAKHSIQDLFAEWLIPESMTGENQVYKYKDDKPTIKADSKRYHVLREPAHQSLFLAALRFALDKTKLEMAKVNTPVTFVDVLSVKTHNPKENKVDKTYAHNYQVKAIVIHQGVMDGGHYYAYVYNNDYKRWEKYNDSEVTVVDEATVRKDSSGTYVFLYELVK